MDIIPVLLLIASIWKIRFTKPIVNIDYEYNGKDNCIALRGFFALVIMISHIRQQTGGGYFMKVFDCTGHLAAAFFFFLSGYGLIKSLGKNNDYVNSFPRKKLETIIIPYITVCCIYWLASLLPWEKRISTADFFRSFINGNPVAAHSWYVIELILLYLAFYLFAVVFKKDKKKVSVAVSFMCVSLIIAFKKLNFGNWWGNSSYGFVVGIVWELFEEKINKTMSKLPFFMVSILACFLMWCVTFAIAFKYYSSGNEIAFLFIRINAAIFPALIMLIMMKVKIESPIMRFIGSISFEFYLIHGLIISICKNLLSPIASDVIWSLIAIIITAFMALLLNRLFKLFRIKKS